MNRNTTNSCAIVARAFLLLLLALAAALQPALAETVERVVYYHQNLQGSTVAATDEAGSVLWREAYSPHGERLLSTDGDDNEIWYTGKPYDQSLGLTYMGARWYDPVLGRFTSVDPVEFEEDNLALFNRYAYGNNNPYTYSDPTGEIAVPVFAIVWGAGAVMTAYDTYRTYQRDGAAAAAGTLARDAAITAVAGPVAARAVRLGGVGRVRRGSDNYVDLASPQRRRHILDGDATGGGHRPGTGKPGKSEFPQGWSDDRIMHEISDVATDPNSVTRAGRGGRTITEGARDGIDIRVIQERNGDIVSGFPTNVPRNPR